MILAGRRINDEMGSHVARRVIKLMTQRRIQAADARVLVLGLAFKENCPDLRNTRVVDVIAEFRSYNAEVHVHDPWVDAAEARHEYGLELVGRAAAGQLRRRDPRGLAPRVPGSGASSGIRGFGKPGSVLFDVKQVLPRDAVDGRL